MLLTIAGIALVVVALARPADGQMAVLGGLGLNMAIVGSFFSLRSQVSRLRARLPRWLPW